MRSTSLALVAWAVPIIAVACASIDDRTLTVSSGSGGAGPSTGGAAGSGGLRDAASDVSVDGSGGAAGASGGAAGASGGAAGASGGAAGGGGGACALPSPAVLELIDDMESGTGWIPTVSGRRGRWYAVWGNDAGTGYDDQRVVTLLPAPRPSGSYAVHSAGGGQVWAVLMCPLSTMPEDGRLTAYDLSRYAGIRFWAKGPGEIRVNVPTADIADSAGGGTCTGTCNDWYNRLVPISGAFEEHTVLFCDMRQNGFMPAAPFDLKKALDVAFAPKDAWNAFDFWIDDVSFILRPGVDGGVTDSGLDGGVMTSMIDDMEDGDDRILTTSGRTGPWYLFRDGASDASITTPPSGPITMSAVTPFRAGSQKCMRVTETGDVGTGVGFGVVLNQPVSVALPYNASGFDGIRMWLRRADATGGDLDLRVAFPTVQTMPGTAPDSCGTDAGLGCYNHFAAHRRVTQTWTLVTVPFSDLGPQWGHTGTFDRTKLLEIQFGVTSTTGSGGFDVLVDDLDLYQDQ